MNSDGARSRSRPNRTPNSTRLETDQGTLADLARDLTRPKKDDGEE